MPEPPKNRGSSPSPEWPLKTGSGKAGDASAPEPKPGDKGKVVHDDRGNAKWDLGLDTARVNKLTTSQLLKKLDVEELSLLDESPDSPQAAPKPGGGFDPYAPADERRSQAPGGSGSKTGTKPAAHPASPGPKPRR